MVVPKSLITVDDILELFEKNKEDMDSTLAREIILRVYKGDYFNILYVCGETALLILLEHFEELQEFEVCATIRDTILEHNNLTNDNIPTKR